MFGWWVNNIPNELRKPVYATLVHLMGEADLAIALTASEALRLCILSTKR